MVGFCASLLALLCGDVGGAGAAPVWRDATEISWPGVLSPSAIPSVSVGLGILVAFSQGPLQMNGTFFIVLAAHFVLISAFTLQQRNDRAGAYFR